MSEKNLPIEFKKVTNPTDEDLHFKYDSANYVLKAGETEDRWSVHMAIHAAKKLADKNIVTTDPQEHRVFVGAYLENSEVEVIAKNLGIDINRIRKEAMTKEKEKSRVINLEAQVAEERAKRIELEKKVDEVLKMKEKEVPVISVETPKIASETTVSEEQKEPEGKIETISTESEKEPNRFGAMGAGQALEGKDETISEEPAEPVKVDKRTKEYKESQAKE